MSARIASRDLAEMHAVFLADRMRQPLPVGRRPGSLMGASRRIPCPNCGLLPRTGRYNDDYCRCDAELQATVDWITFRAFARGWDAEVGHV